MNRAPEIQPLPGEESAWAAFRALRSLVNLILLGLIIVTSSLTIYFIREIQIARRQRFELEGRVDEYNRLVAPRIDELRVKLDAFTKLHPEFMPIYSRYFPTNSPGANSMSVIPIAEPPPR